MQGTEGEGVTNNIQSTMSADGTQMISCPKCGGTGKDVPLDPMAPRGTLENPMTRDEAIARGIPVDQIEAEAHMATPDEVAALFACSHCNGIGWVEAH